MRSGTRMTIAVGWATGLGAVPLGAVFNEWDWVWYAWAAVAAVVGGHLLARSLRLPPVVVPLLGALSLLEYLTVVFAADAALAGLLISPSSLEALNDSLRSGLNDVNELAAPVPATPGLVVLTAAAIGAMTILVDVVAVVMRRPAAAGLALLALYAVPTAVAFDGVPWLLFVVGASGYLVLLMAEGRERLMRWGRPVGRPAGTDDDGPLPYTGQRIGAAALALAVVVPLLVPGLTANVLYDIGRGSSGEGTGDGQGTSQNPFTSLQGELRRSQPVNLFEVRVDHDNPFYLRTNVLEDYTPGGWRQRTRQFRDGESVPGRFSLPAAQNRGTVPERAYEATITVQSYSGRNLPSYYLPLRVEGDIPEFWRYDRDTGVIYSRARANDGYQYTVTGVEPQPSRDDLENAGPLTPDERQDVQSWMLAPGGLPPEVRAAVTDAVRGTSTPFGQALALYHYFTDGSRGFRYSLQTRAGNSGDALVDFLKGKQGYCEQYASAMAIMLRAIGIPSRVVLGYTPGIRNQETGVWTVQSKDSHAWVEAYFSGQGWVSFDPTPLSDGRAVDLPYAPNPLRSASPSTSSSASGAAVPTNGAAPDARDPNDLEAAGTSGGGGGGGALTPRTALAGAGGIAVLALLGAPALARLAVRRRRLRAARGPDPAAAARAAWDEVHASAIDYRVPMPDTETPRSTVTRLARDVSLDEAGVAAVRLVALAEERARYAPTAGVDGDLPAAVRTFQRGLRADAEPRRRWLALLLPLSALRAARAGSSTRAAAAAAAVDRLGVLARQAPMLRRSR